MLSRSPALVVFTAALAGTLTLARPLIAREPSLGSAPAALAARSVQGPSPDVTIEVSHQVATLPGMDYDLFPVIYLPEDPNNADKAIKLDEAAGLKHVLFPNAGGYTSFVQFDADKSTKGQMLAYNKDKTAIVTTDYSKFDAFSTPGSWDIQCGPPPMSTSAQGTSQLCALYFSGEDRKCLKKVNGAFVVDLACDKAKVNANQVRSYSHFKGA